jgi:single-stranded-DNA-specific exonuclease
MPKWIQRTSDADIPLMSRTLNLHPAVAAAMANRGVRSRRSAAQYLSPDPAYFHDPALFKGIEQAASIITQSIADCKRIVVYGDYDVDGITGTVILHKTLKCLGADVSYYIPHREHEGYGLNPAAAEKLIKAGAGLIVTCDNGVASHAEIAMFHKKGVRVVVIDHHELADIPCGADAMINQKQPDCGYPYKNLCACGLAYKFAEYLFSRQNLTNLHAEEFLILTAVATYCDVVDLDGENRLIVKLGMRMLNGNKAANLGLNALINARQLNDREIGAFEVGFVIGPCINATGRLDSASLAVDLFLTDNGDEARTLAAKLCVLNDERKTLTANSVELILREIDKPEYSSQRVLVLYKPEIHESIAGIVAGRIKEAVHKPTIVLTKGLEFVKGSARSIEAYNIHDELSKNRDLFVRFGGHAMAAGLSLEERNIDELRRRLNEDCTLTEEDLQSVMYFDGHLCLSEVTLDLARQITLMRPFGKAHHEPTFITENVEATTEAIGSLKNVLRFTFAAPSGRLRGIAFGQADKFNGMGLAFNTRISLDIIYSVEINEYNGNVAVQLNVKDFKDTNDTSPRRVHHEP